MICLNWMLKNRSRCYLILEMKKILIITLIIPFLINCKGEKANNSYNVDNIDYVTTDDGIVGDFDRDKYPVLQDAILLKLNGETIKSIEKFNRAEELYGQFIPIYLNRGVAYNQIGEKEKAISDFTKCLEINPKYLPALLNRGLGYIHINQIELALKDINKAIEINPTEPSSYLNRAVAYRKNNQFHLACADLEKSRSLGIAEKYNSQMAEIMMTEINCDDK